MFIGTPINPSTLLDKISSPNTFSISVFSVASPVTFIFNVTLVIAPSFAFSFIFSDIFCCTNSLSSVIPLLFVSFLQGLNFNAISEPSNKVSPSVSSSKGFVLYVFISSPSFKPSLSVSFSPGFKPADTSYIFVRPSSSVSS